MSYIVQEKRYTLDKSIDQLHHALVELEMDDDENGMEENVNYAIIRLLMMVYGDEYTTNYSQVNDAMGVLGSVSAEFYRKVAAKHQNQKAHNNGEISRFPQPGEIVGEVLVQTEGEGC